MADETSITPKLLAEAIWVETMGCPWSDARPDEQRRGLEEARRILRRIKRKQVKREGGE